MIYFDRNFGKKHATENLELKPQDISFKRLFIFPRKLTNIHVLFDCYFDTVDRLNDELATDHDILPDNYMTFRVCDKEYNFISSMICDAEVGDDLFELEQGTQISVAGIVIAVGTPSDPREPIFLVSHIEVLGGKLDFGDDDDDDPFQDFPDDIVSPEDFCIIDGDDDDEEIV